MIWDDDGVEVEDGVGRVEEEVERGRGVVAVVVVEGVVVVMEGVVGVKMITCLVVWQPSQDWGWAALGVGDKDGEGVKNIVNGVDEEGGED